MGKYRRSKIPQVGFINKSIHYYLGEPYRLYIENGNFCTSVSIEGRSIILNINGNEICRDKCRAVMNKWYSERLKEKAFPMINKWENIIKVQTNEVRTKHMLTRWGTCNISKKRIWLNTELIKKKEEQLEYVVVHELVHLLEKGHNRVFYGYMDKFLPDWKIRKKELNSFLP